MIRDHDSAMGSPSNAAVRPFWPDFWSDMTFSENQTPAFPDGAASHAFLGIGFRAP
jgi:hypothetical protein